MNVEMVQLEQEPIGDGTARGGWIVPAVSYVDPVRRFCAYCGRPIARQYWATPRDEEERTYCSPAHADRDTTYPNR